MKTPSIYQTTSPGLRNTMKLYEEKKNDTHKRNRIKNKTNLNINKK